MREARGLGSRAEEVLRAARELLEEHGHDGLRMRLLADRLGIKAPTLYGHFASKRDLENALIAIGLQEQAQAAADALGDTPPEEAPGRMWSGYRAWALRNPALHQLIGARALDRDDPAVAAAERPGAEMVLRSARGDRPTALASWAFAYGMVALELNGRVPPGQDLDAVWRAGLARLTTGPG
jgi:AcrR family transcriptional regulator